MTPGKNQKKDNTRTTQVRIESQKKVKREKGNSQNDTSYVSTYKNYKPDGGRRIEKSSAGEEELRESAFKHAKADNNKQTPSKTTDDEKKKEDEEERLKSNVSYSRFEKRGDPEFGKDYDTDFDWTT